MTESRAISSADIDNLAQQFNDKVLGVIERFHRMDAGAQISFLKQLQNSESLIYVSTNKLTELITSTVDFNDSRDVVNAALGLAYILAEEKLLPSSSDYFVRQMAVDGIRKNTAKPMEQVKAAKFAINALQNGVLNQTSTVFEIIHKARYQNNHEVVRLEGAELLLAGTRHGLFAGESNVNAVGHLDFVVNDPDLLVRAKGGEILQELMDDGILSDEKVENFLDKLSGSQYVDTVVMRDEWEQDKENKVQQMGGDLEALEAF